MPDDPNAFTPFDEMLPQDQGAAITEMEQNFAGIQEQLEIAQDRLANLAGERPDENQDDRDPEDRLRPAPEPFQDDDGNEIRPTPLRTADETEVAASVVAMETRLTTAESLLKQIQEDMNDSESSVALVGDTFTEEIERYVTADEQLSGDDNDIHDFQVNWEIGGTTVEVTGGTLVRHGGPNKLDLELTVDGGGVSGDSGTVKTITLAGGPPTDGDHYIALLLTDTANGAHSLDPTVGANGLTAIDFTTVGGVNTYPIPGGPGISRYIALARVTVSSNVIDSVQILEEQDSVGQFIVPDGATPFGSPQIYTLGYNTLSTDHKNELGLYGSWLTSERTGIPVSRWRAPGVEKNAGGDGVMYWWCADGDITGRSTDTGQRSLQIRDDGTRDIAQIWDMHQPVSEVPDIGNTWFVPMRDPQGGTDPEIKWIYRDHFADYIEGALSIGWGQITGITFDHPSLTGRDTDGHAGANFPYFLLGSDGTPAENWDRNSKGAEDNFMGNTLFVETALNTDYIQDVDGNARVDVDGSTLTGAWTSTVSHNSAEFFITGAGGFSYWNAANFKASPSNDFVVDASNDVSLSSANNMTLSPRFMIQAMTSNTVNIKPTLTIAGWTEMGWLIDESVGAYDAVIAIDSSEQLPTDKILVQRVT